MKNLIKKNQLMISALAVMIAIAGYLQFAGKNPVDKLQSTSSVAVKNSTISESENKDVLIENYIAQSSTEISDEEELLAGLTDVDSLDSEYDSFIVDDYLDFDMAETSELAKDGQPTEGEIPGEAVFTSGEGVTILSEAKLMKEQTRAKNKETLLSIINSEGLTDIQKQTAVDTMVNMTAIAEKEAAAEILLEAKGFTDVVVSINGDAVDVVVNAAVLDDAKRAQIEDIVKRKTDIAPENIIISTITK